MKLCVNSWKLLLASDWLRVCRRIGVTAEVTPWFYTFVKYVFVAACCKLNAHYTSLTLSCDWVLTAAQLPVQLVLLVR